MVYNQAPVLKPQMTLIPFLGSQVQASLASQGYEGSYPTEELCPS